MTICLAVSDGTKAIIASDTQLMSGSYIPDAAPKWVVGDDLAVAVAGDYLTYNLILEHWNEFESLTGKGDSDTSIFRAFVIALYDKHDYKPSEAKGSRGWGNEFILATAEEVVEFDETLCAIAKPPGAPAVVGAGMAYAAGAFYAARGSLKTRIQTALRVTNEICSECSGEYLHVLRS